MYETVLSSKGQLILPSELRKMNKQKKGTRFAVYPTEFGYELIEIPKNPVKALRGPTKDLGIPSSAIKKMRQEDDKIFRGKHNIR